MINLWAKSHSSWRKFCNLGRKQKFYLTAFVSYVKQKAGMRNRMYDGVGGAKSEVGDKYL